MTVVLVKEIEMQVPGSLQQNLATKMKKISSLP